MDSSRRCFPPNVRSVAAAAWLVPFFLYANGATMGRSGRDITPVQNDSIRLVSEFLKIRQAGSLMTDCYYLLENIAATSQEFEIGFSFGDTAFDNVTGSDFALEVDGQKREFKLEVIKDRASPVTGFAHYAVWQMRMRPAERSMVHVQQRLEWATADAEMGYLLGMSSQHFFYQLSLANEWAGRPERIDVYFNFGDDRGSTRDDPLWGVSKAIEIMPPGYWWADENEIAWCFENADSLEDISIGILMYDYEPTREEVLGSFLETFDRASYDADRRQYEEKDVSYMGIDETPEKAVDLENLRRVRMLISDYYPAFVRNTIYAVHGYRFQEELWRSLFAGCDWYRPVDDFAPSFLNELEHRNIAFIKEHELHAGDEVKDKH